MKTDLRISGYASVFDQTDLSGDRVAKGAFSASLLSRRDKLPMLFGHKTDTPIGVWDRVVEDRHGLFVSGRILSGTGLADQTIRLVREYAVTGLSIGYRTKRSKKSKGGRTLLDLDLWEVSVVAFPMLRSARITQIGDTNRVCTHKRISSGYEANSFSSRRGDEGLRPQGEALRRRNG